MAKDTSFQAPVYLSNPKNAPSTSALMSSLYTHMAGFQLGEVLVHASVQIHHNINGGHQDLGGDEYDDDPLQILAYTNMSANTPYSTPAPPTNPRKTDKARLTMRMTQLILQHRQ